MATSTNSTTNSATSTTQVKSPKRRKLVIVLVVLLALAGMAAGAGYYFFGHSEPKAAAKMVTPPPADPIYVALQPFTVNLQTNDRFRMLHTVVTLQVMDIKSQELVTKYLPLVHGRVRSVLSNRESDLLRTDADTVKLAAEIMAVLNKPFAPNLPVATISKVELFPFMMQ